MSLQKFSARLFRMGETGKWLCLRIPFDVPKVFGSRARIAACRKEFVQWIEQAKRPETRARRAAEAAGRILEKLRIP